MKKILLLSFFTFSVLLGFSQDTNNQEKSSDKKEKSTKRQSSSSNSQEFSWGVRAGLNISNLDFDPDPTFENTHRNGFMIGFYCDINFSDSFAVSPEIQFSAEGAKADDLRAEYLNLPILVKYKIGDRFAIGIGPQASLKVHEYEDNFKNFVFSGVGGIEYNIWDDFYIDARVNYGFMNLLDDEFDIEAKQINYQFGFGIKI